MKKAIIPVLFLLFLLSIACTSADYAAAFHIEYEGQERVSPLSPLPVETVQLEATIPTRTTESSPTWSVCTSSENGMLRVRNKPGTSEEVVFLLEEGQSVYFEGFIEERTDDGAMWIKIVDPTGWVNKRFLCEGK
ncbi:MAG: SH3 domain-containing protein [Anaerolineae bacterium]|jgi:hypothetical protein|nr:SH3 domain-containing protein [Anaerolineae bacterium]MBT7783466.1 SH3 domain-containing protein [Anaerolineae bacterium]